MSRKTIAALVGLFALSFCSRPKPVGSVDVGGGTYSFLTCIPLSGATVRAGNRAPVTTDANGAFHVSGVQLPYDVVALSPTFAVADTNSGIAVYRRLTRPDPAIYLSASASSWNQQVTVSGNLGGALGTNATYTVVHLSADGLDSTCTVDGSASPWTYACNNVPWYGSAALSAKLRALSWNVDANGAPTDYVGFVEKDISLTSGATISSVDLTLAAVPGKTTVAGSVSAPTGYTVNREALEVELSSPTARFMVFTPSTISGTSFSFFAPTLTGARVAVTAGAVSGAGEESIARSLMPAAGGNVSITLPAAPALTAPDNAATIHAGAVLKWSAVPGASYIVTASLSAAASLFAVTSDPEFTIPDLSDMNAALPAAASYSWSVMAAAPCATADVAADRALCGVIALVYSPIVTGAAPPPDLPQVAVGVSAQRTFTIGP